MDGHIFIPAFTIGFEFDFGIYCFVSMSNYSLYGHAASAITFELSSLSISIEFIWSNFACENCIYPYFEHCIDKGKQ